MKRYCNLAVLLVLTGCATAPQPPPGEINAEVTQENIKQTICLVGWTATVRPATRYTDAIKLKLCTLFCKYIQFYYRAGRYISVRWIDGNQSFDAKLHQKGAYVDQGYHPETAHLEVTSAIDENEHWIWQLLSNGRPAFAPEGITKAKGEPVVSELVGFANAEHVERFVPSFCDN
jgi:hypothetical protein